MNQTELKTSEIQPVDSEASAQLVVVARLRRQLADLMRIDAHTVTRPPDAVITFQGEIHEGIEAAFEQMTQRMAPLGYTVMLRDQPGGGHEVIAVKGKIEHKPSNMWVNAVLFLATLFSVLYIGALNELDASMVEGVEPFRLLFLPLAHIHRGLPFAGTLMSILLAHELSHYFVARRYGSPVSLPYFIPLPVPFFSLLGTMGAVILQKAPMRNRRALFDIGIAGPLGGLIVAIPLLVLGLSLSDVGLPPPDIEAAWQEGNSLLYLGIKYLVFGKILPSNGEDVWLHSVAFAAWAGLWITMMNLVPVGQLDGGHVSYALLGRRAHTLGFVVIATMLGWGGWTLMSGNTAGGFWLMWGFLNMVLNPRHPPPLDDAAKLDWRRILVGLFMLAVFVLLFMPVPLQPVQF